MNIPNAAGSADAPPATRARNGTGKEPADPAEAPEKEPGRRNTRMAIIYDFDGTLAPGNMQERQFIPDVGMKAEDFWDEVNRVTHENNTDQTLSYMFVMMQKALQAGRPIRREHLERKAEEIKLFPGVEGWFGRVNRHAGSQNVRLEHYVVSSGNSEIIEAAPIARHFTRIYASRFLYGENGEAIWPAMAVNFTTKTQYLFRINKGALDPKDNSRINEHVPQWKRPVPFRNMIYIGDGETDVPCFRLVHDLGGLAVAVYGEGAREYAAKFVEQNRVSMALPADYRAGSALDSAVQGYVTLTALRAQVETKLRGTTG